MTNEEGKAALEERGALRYGPKRRLDREIRRGGTSVDIKIRTEKPKGGDHGPTPAVRRNLGRCGPINAGQ